MKLSLLTDAFFASRTLQGLSPHTVDNDRAAAKKLIAVTGDIDVTQVTRAHIDIVFARSVDAGHMPGTINALHSSLRAFFNWCEDEGHVSFQRNPMKRRRWHKNPKKARPRVPMRNFPQLLDAASNPRDRMVIALGLYLLLRQGEATNLRIKDVDLDEGIVKVTISKTGDYDEMPITQELDRELRAWYQHYAQECGPLDPRWYLIPAMRPSGFQTFSLAPDCRITKSEDIIRRTLSKIGMEGKGMGMHVLRRSAARAVYDELAARGVDNALRKTAAWCHHSSTTTTETYLGLDVDRAGRDVEYRNRSMYPSLEGDNVVRMGRRDEHQADEAM